MLFNVVFGLRQVASGYEQVGDSASPACDITVRDGMEINALQLRHDRMLADILIKSGIRALKPL